MTRSREAEGGLRRQLGLVDGVAIFVGIILGSGIFVAPAAVAGAAPGFLSATGLWLLAGIVAACGAFCYAECGARLPRTGGFYVFYREVYGEAVAFIAGWAGLLITYPASTAAIAVIFSRYLTEAFPGLPGGRWSGAAAVIAAGVLNALGVRVGAWTQRLLTGAKVLALATLCIAAVLFGGSSDGAGSAVPPLQLASAFPILLLALMNILWTYDGWSDVTLVSGEIRNPGRNLGRTVVLGASVLVVLYVLVQLAVLALLGPERAAASEGVVAEAVQEGLGVGFSRTVALLVVVSTLGSINGIVLSTSRLGFAMARDGVFLRWFGTVSRFGTPARAIGALVTVTVVYTLRPTFDALLVLFSFSVWIFYSLTAIAVFVLRRRGVGDPAAWRAPGGAIPPVVVLLTAAAMVPGVAALDPPAALRGFLLLAAGYPVWLLWRSFGRRRTG